MKTTEDDQLEVLLENYLALKESKLALDRFEIAMVKLIAETLEELSGKVKQGLKVVEKETGYDWSCYLEGFDLCRWDTPGDFQEEIASSLKAAIAKELTK
jgi:hypothetical protein